MADTSWDEVVNAWVKRGAPRVVAEGWADNVGRESSFRSTVFGDGRTSVGLYQAHADRMSSLQSLKNWEDPEVQHDWAKSQVTGGDRIATAHWDEIKNARTREEARELIKRYFFRPAVTQTDKPGGRFAQSGIDFEQGRSNTSVRYMDPEDYLDMLPPISDSETGGKNKRRALMKSLMAGDEIEAIPTIELSGTGDKRKIADFDGRHRAQAAADAGITMMPVAFRGVEDGQEPKEIVGKTGQSIPFSFAQVPKMIGDIAGELFGVKSAAAGEMPKAPTTAPWLRQAAPPQAPPPPTVQPVPPQETPYKDRAPWLDPGGAAPRQTQPPPVRQEPGFLEREVERAKEFATAPAYLAAGAARLPVGAAQAVAHGAEALGIPGAATVAGATDVAARGLEGFVQRGGEDAPYLAGAGDIAASLALPAGRIAQLPRLAQPIAQAGVGAAIGAAQPVTEGDYGAEKTGQVLGSAAAGGILGVIGQGLAAAGRLVNKAVTPEDVTRAAGRLFGADTKKLTPEVIKKQRDRIGNTMETIERSVDVPLRTKDHVELNRILSEAETMLPKEFNPIKSIIDHVIDKGSKTVNVITPIPGRISRLVTPIPKNIPGDEIADLLHKNNPLEALTRHSDPNIARYAIQIQETLRDMINSALPPAARDVYSAARAEWRDMKIVSDSLDIGRHVVDPREYSKQVAKRFPLQAEGVPAVPPPVLRLGRAVGELFGEPRRAAEALPTAAGLGAFAATHAALGPFGSAAAYMGGHGAGHMARNRLVDLAFARSQNALAAIQPQRSPGMQRFRNMLTGLSSPQIPAAAATAATMP